MRSNFDFLEEDFPVLYQIGNISEKYLFSDSNSCLIKLGMFGETIVNLMFKLDGIEIRSEDKQINKINTLYKKGILPDQIKEILHALRVNRNHAVHANYDEVLKCKTLLQMTYHLAVWFMKVYIDNDIKIQDYFEPTEEHSDYLSIIDEKEKVISELNKKISEIESQNISEIERAKKAKKAVDFINISERETRYLIDEQLRRVGWEANTQSLRYSNGTRPQKGRNIAIAEWPTEKILGKTNYADYALFVGEQMVGIIEAKKLSKDIPSIIDTQCKEYAKTIKSEYFSEKLVAQSESEYIVNNKKNYNISDWNGYKVPFVFATNGRKYLRQIETKSGIWFLDLRENANIPKVLSGWMSPEGILENLQKDIKEANENLKNIPFDFLRDKNGLNLRDYQIQAIETAENSIKNGQQKVLLSMATGTGKTRTILGMIYRFLKSDRFKRILFLVDRNSLGKQAADVFCEVKLEDLMTINDIYNINTLEYKKLNIETRLQIDTVQSLVKKIMHNNDEKIPAVSDYDLIIVDEAHRGYTLDKELDEDELIYRNQDEFISKYKSVIDYFDAVKIALTATPALHTTEIFGKPVFNYSYREAVIDGYLVDHDPPHNIKTKLSSEGIAYSKGDSVAIFDPTTGEIINGYELEDEIKFDVDQFNRRVITENFNRVVLEEIAYNLDPEGKGKTLIYAVDNTHADLIVKILREIYEPHGVNQDAITKITGSIGDNKRVEEAIRRFKNESNPNIVVTVDLLTTGIDVPEITTLVFMRRIKSRILFEQMLGRATRLCNEIGKTHFEIYDPVGVYESLQDVSTMKPVVVNPKTNFDDLLDGLELLTEDKIQKQLDIIVAKMRRKLKNISKNDIESFENITGLKTPNEFIEKISNLSINEAKQMVLKNRLVFDILEKSKGNMRKPVFISEKEDELLSHTYGYGNGKKPEDYLEEFKIFVHENIERIEALKLVCTKPTSLTRKALKSLRIILDQHGYSEQQLNNALKNLKNEEITADIISIIRSQFNGAEIVNHDQRIRVAIKKLKSKHKFSKMEENWLDRIESNLLAETILNLEDFDTGIFRDNGGLNKINSIFNNRLNEYILELNEYLYEDGGIVA